MVTVSQKVKILNLIPPRMWCRTSTTSAATSVSVTNFGSRLTSTCPGASAKVCSIFLLVLALSLNFLSPDFFIQLDQECGPLTLHSSLKDLVYYTRRGLRTLSASTSDEAASVAPPPFFHPPGPSEQDHKSVLKWWGGRIESQTMKEALWTWCPHSRQACLVMLPIRAYQDIMPEKGVLRLGANTTPFWTGDVTAMTRFCDN